MSLKAQGVLAGCKDKVLSEALRLFAETHVRRYGTIQSLEIDSASKRLRISLVLEGEREPIVVEASGYTVTSEGGKYYLEVRGITSSRPWAQTLIRDLVEAKRICLPPALAHAITHLA